MEGEDCGSGLLGGEIFGSWAKNVEQEKSTLRNNNTNMLGCDPWSSWMC